MTGQQQLSYRQGDQIVQIFAYWVVAYFDIENYYFSFYPQYKLCIILTNM
jgi:hypothetical protein